MLSTEKKENTFAQRLKAARKNIHRTGKDVAEMAGMNYQTYMSYENDTRSILPSAENLIKISNVLGVSTDYLLKGDKSVKFVPGGQNVDDSSSDESDIDVFINKIIDLLSNDKNVNFRGYPITSDNAKLALTQALYTVKIMARFPPKENQAADGMYNQSRQNADYFRQLQEQEKKSAGKEDKPAQ